MNARNSLPPKKLLGSTYRKELWKNAEHMIKRIEKILPVSNIHLLGSFVTKKRRPADVDFIVMLQVPERQKNAKWSLDMVISPDNKHGKQVLEDAKKWMKQKYGSKNSEVISYR